MWKLYTIFGFSHHFVSCFGVDVIVAKCPGMCRTVLYNLIMSLSCKNVVLVQEELYQMFTPREGFSMLWKIYADQLSNLDQSTN